MFEIESYIVLEDHQNITTILANPGTRMAKRLMILSVILVDLQSDNVVCLSELKRQIEPWSQTDMLRTEVLFSGK